jgi:hypothetical protein
MELIENGGFEEDAPLAHWAGTAVLDTVASTAHAGSRSARLQGTAFLQQKLERRFQLVYSTEGAITLWARNLQPSGSALILYISYAYPRMPEMAVHELAPGHEWIQLRSDLITTDPIRSVSFACVGDLLIDDVSLVGQRVFTFLHFPRLLRRWLG